MLVRDLKYVYFNDHFDVARYKRYAIYRSRVDHPLYSPNLFWIEVSDGFETYLVQEVDEFDAQLMFDYIIQCEEQRTT